MEKKMLFIASIMGALAVILGAFGAHSLRALISEKSLSIFETGVRYHFYHTFAIFTALLLSKKDTNHRFYRFAALSFLIGIFLFSGSLYLLATREILGLQTLTPILGPMTPLGGLAFITGWASLATAILKTNHQQ